MKIFGSSHNLKNFQSLYQKAEKISSLVLRDFEHSIWMQTQILSPY